MNLLTHPHKSGIHENAFLNSSATFRIHVSVSNLMSLSRSSAMFCRWTALFRTAFEVSLMYTQHFCFVKAHVTPCANCIRSNASRFCNVAFRTCPNSSDHRTMDCPASAATSAMICLHSGAPFFLILVSINIL